LSAPHHDVGRLQVTMRDAFAMGGRKRIRQRDGHTEQPFQR
jgi:hypothetical protein